MSPADPLAGLRDGLDALGPALDAWNTRTGHGSAAERRAASTAVGAIDAMLRTLYSIRGRLVREVSTADAAVLEDRTRHSPGDGQ